jgi:hypothetical protein
MSKDAAQHLLDEFNDGNWDEVGAYFNEDFGLFMDYLGKYGLHNEIDYNNIDEEFQNKLLLIKLEKHPQETLNFICDNLITDVYPMKDGYYLYLKDRTELADLFKSYSRDTSPYDVAKAVLGEDGWDPYWDTTDDVYRDVIDQLNKENLRHLGNYIIKQIGNQDLNIEDYESDFFDELAETQNREGFFRITENDVMGLIKDEEAMNELLNGDLEDLKSELYSLHNSSYNHAYESEIYNYVWNELETYFVPKSWEYQEKERYDGKKITHEYLKIRNFHSDIYDFLSNNEWPSWSDAYLGYNSSYCGLIRNMMDNGEKEWLSFRIPDYPDWTLIKKEMNEMITSYI